MDEALELSEYMPNSLAAASEQAYLDFLWAAFQTNYEQGRYEFASLAFHLLYMSFVSFSIWQIRLARPDQFKMAMVGFRAEDEGVISDCDSPFKFYDKMKESQIFRFLKLIGCDNQQIGEFAKFVKRRNQIAHPTGTVFFNDQQALDEEISSMMREVRNIEEHMEPVVLELYRDFLLGSADAESREFASDEDQLQAKLVHAHYMSSADLRHCTRFDIGALDEDPRFEAILALHATLAAIVATDELEDA
jgi:hypothetical protein